MLNPTVHIALALAMVVLGSGAAWIMLEAFGGRTPKERSRSRARLHRLLGRAFVLIYLVMLVSMTRMAMGFDELGAVAAVHAGFALLLLPILAIKILIVRRYEPLQRHLPLFGSAVFILTVATVGLGLLATHRSGGGAEEAAAVASLPEHPGRQPFLDYCGQCHALARPLTLATSQNPDEARWTSLVQTMRARAASRGRRVWTDAEASQIVGFLLAVGKAGPGATQGLPTAGGGDDGGDDHGRGRGRGRGRDDR